METKSLKILKMKNKRIFITGGHLAPAKAVISELVKRGGWQIYYIGRKYSLEGEKAIALEYSEIGQIPLVTYLTITTGRLQRQFSINIVQSIVSLLKVFIGLTQAFFWTIKYRPNKVLSFGGHVAIPVVIWAWLLGVPVVTHEQTTVYGRANRFIGFFAKKILVSWPESLGVFPKAKTILTGNPIREEIIRQKSVRQPRLDRGQPSDRQPVIYISGGSQGAHAINIAVEKILPQLLARCQVVHQTGSSERFHDWQRLQLVKSKNYQAYRQLSGQESAKVLAGCDLLVSRSGANTVTEILYLGIPAILIPLPRAFGNEQERNAGMVAKTGLAEVLLQKDLTPKKLLLKIDDLIANRQEILKHQGQALAMVIPDAAKKIVDQLEMI